MVVRDATSLGDGLAPAYHRQYPVPLVNMLNQSTIAGPLSAGVTTTPDCLDLPARRRRHARLIVALTELNACADAVGAVYRPIAAAPPGQEAVKVNLLPCIQVSFSAGLLLVTTPPSVPPCRADLDDTPLESVVLEFWMRRSRAALRRQPATYRVAQLLNDDCPQGPWGQSLFTCSCGSVAAQSVRSLRPSTFGQLLGKSLGMPGTWMVRP